MFYNHTDHINQPTHSFCSQEIATFIIKELAPSIPPENLMLTYNYQKLAQTVKAMFPVKLKELMQEGGKK